MILWVDLECQGTADLKTVGAYNYARDPGTNSLCFGWAIDDGEVQLWRRGEPIPPAVAGHTGQIRAHNAAFERLIFWYDLQLDFKPTQYYCTGAQARANCAPGALADAGRFLGAKMQKDHAGAALLRKCCQPPFAGTAADYTALEEYCKQDVRAMRAMSLALRELTADELADYHVNEQINDRGILVDVALCVSAQEYSAAETNAIENEVWELTSGAVNGVRTPSLRAWVAARLTPEQLPLMVGKGGRESIDKSVRAALLACPDLDAGARAVVALADSLWASSIAKFARLGALADVENGRVRGAFVFNGGAATGRYASFGAQVHNFARRVVADPDATRAAMIGRLPLVPDHGPRITDVLRGMLRPALVPARGKLFVTADWSAIEGRVNPWLADTPAGEDKLDVFRAGQDPYKRNAAATYSVGYDEVSEQQRQVGKVQELALGFGGGAGAFEAMARGYGVVMSEAEVKAAIRKWRGANPWAVEFWSQLESAYLAAMRRPGTHQAAGRITYYYDKRHLWYALPSGRVLCYPYAEFGEDGSVEFAKAALKPATGAARWPRARLWHGLACENVTQACAADLLRHALRAVADTAIMHVHDEIVLEVPRRDAERAREALVRIMESPPAWAGGLPLAATSKIRTCFGK
jgi:DNA polymerase